MSTLAAVVIGALACIGLLTLLSALATWVLFRDVEEPAIDLRDVPDVDVAERLRGYGRDVS